MANILHILNGDAPRPAMEQSSLSGTFSAWPDVLHDGFTPLATGEEWIRARCGYLESMASDLDQSCLEQYRASDAVLESWPERDEVVFWFEHDLFDQLLLIRHLWWMKRNAADRARHQTRFSLVCGNEYIGMMKPEWFPPRFAAREPITDDQIASGSEVWEAYCSGEPTRLVEYATHNLPAKADLPPKGGSRLTFPYLQPAMLRLLEEFPSATNGLARSERQILEVLADGPRTPEQTFIAASRLEEAIYMGDLSFWDIVKRLNAGAHPLLTLDVQERPGRLPDGTLRITEKGRAVLAGRADHIALNAPSRWLGGTFLTPERSWRWTGSSLQLPAP
jgi:hypothetical protein